MVLTVRWGIKGEAWAGVNCSGRDGQDKIYFCTFFFDGIYKLVYLCEAPEIKLLGLYSSSSYSICKGYIKHS